MNLEYDACSLVIDLLLWSSLLVLKIKPFFLLFLARLQAAHRRQATIRLVRGLFWRSIEQVNLRNGVILGSRAVQRIVLADVLVQVIRNMRKTETQ